MNTAAVADEGLELFTDYFVRNYPGPRTIISDPKWHAPKIFRAALYAIEDHKKRAGGTTALAPFDFLNHLVRQREWSTNTFGPGERTSGVIDHIRKELLEIEAAPDDLSEWADVVILALDGAWRAGATPQQIIDAIVAKQTKNESRRWPDWRTAELGKAIEHVRDGEAAIAKEGA